MILSHRIAVFALLVAINISCKIDSSKEVKLPEPLMEGQSPETQNSVSQKANFGYLSCKMDGVEIKAIQTGAMMLYVPDKKEINIWGKTDTGMISIIIDNVENTGTYTIKGNSKNGAGVMIGANMFEVKKSGTPFDVTIESFEEISAINSPNARAIRGTFQGKLMGQDGKIVEITEGKFSTQ